MIIYIIGTGNMGGGIAKALAKKGQRVFVYNRTFAKAKILAKQKNITADKNFENLSKADVVILGVKPQDMANLAQEIKGKIKPSAIIISVVAGWRLNVLVSSFGSKKIVRIMPTLAFLVGQGVTVLKFTPGLTFQDKNKVKRLLALFTEYFEIKDENLIDVGGVIYGSAKAFYFLLADALEKAGIKFGIDAKTSHWLTGKTFLGAALLQQGQTFPSLIEKVATKNGVTEAALKVFYHKNLKEIVEQAVESGIKRTKELSNG